ncbi:MAG TPA: tRNA 4-thiouridine(8) synthase ThiI, partial [Methanomicrobia archaeon]|nr:tRNA 4-thiouridine(8) synthase ThiI [Methanomicrobia archaeon]
MFLSLNSGGIDSPVAAYLVLKKRYDLDFIYFRTDGESEKKTLKTIKIFSDIFKKKFKLYSIDHAS